MSSSDGVTALGRRHGVAAQVHLLDPFRRAGRKTLRQVKERRSPCEMPDYTVSIVLPPGYSLAPGPQPFGLTCTLSQPCGLVTITGKNRDFLLKQGREFLTRMGIPRWQAVLRRADEPGPTLSGPTHKGFERVIWLEARNARVVETEPDGLNGMRELPLC